MFAELPAIEVGDLLFFWNRWFLVLPTLKNGQQRDMHYVLMCSDMYAPKVGLVSKVLLQESRTGYTFKHSKWNVP